MSVVRFAAGRRVRDVIEVMQKGAEWVATLVPIDGDRAELARGESLDEIERFATHAAFARGKTEVAVHRAGVEP